MNTHKKGCWNYRVFTNKRILTRQSITFYTILMLMLLTLGGCSNGDTDSQSPSNPGPDPTPAPTTILLSGTVEKGPFTELSMSVYTLNEQNVSEQLPVTINGSDFEVEAPVDAMVYFSASGNYTNEYTGNSTSLSQPLLLISPANDEPKNINVLTDLSARLAMAQAEADATANNEPLPNDGSRLPISSNLIDKSTTLINESLGLPGATKPSQLSFANLPDTPDLDDPNLQLLLISAHFLAFAQENSLETANSNDEDVGLGTQYLEITHSFAQNLQAQNQNSNEVASNMVTGQLMASMNGLNPVFLLNELHNREIIVNTPIIVEPIYPVVICNPTCLWMPFIDPSVSISSTSVYEANGVAGLRVSRTGSVSEALTLNYGVGGTATPNRDYLALPNVFTLPAGVRSANIPLELIIDTIDEPTEEVSITLTSAANESGTSIDIANANASVSVLNGAPADELTPVLAASEVCVLELANSNDISPANSLVTPLDANCLASPLNVVFDKNETPVIRLGLAVNSPSGNSVSMCANNCPDQLLDLALSYTQTDGTTNKVHLGQYRFPASGITNLSSSAGVTNSVLVALSGDNVLTAINTAFGKNDAAISVANASDQILGNTPFDTRAEFTNVIVLPQSVSFGDRELAFLDPSFDPIASNANCPAGNVAIQDDFQYAITIEGITDEQTIAGSACINIDGLDVNASAVVSESQIEVSNGATYIQLPDWHQMLIARPITSGAQLPTELFSTTSLEFLLWAPSVLSGFKVYLGAEHLPFMYEISGVRLTQNGFELGYNTTRLRADMNFANDDPRRGNKMSNMSPFGGASAGSLLLGINGITASTQFTAGSSSTSYPSGELTWGAFSAPVNDGVLEPGNTNVEFAMAQFDGCQLASCSGNGQREYAISVANAEVSSMGVYGQGFIDHSSGLAWGQNEAWIAPQTASVNAPATLHMPGNEELSATAVSKAIDLLQAHRNASTHHIRGSEAFALGNLFPVGITFGPELYSNSAGQPDVGVGNSLAGQVVSFVTSQGQIDATSHLATKWVLTNDGVSGVLNADPATLPYATNLQGFDFSFSRFAVRTRQNTLDEFNWVDGSTQLFGDAGGSEGLDINFANLVLDCTGQLGRSRLSAQQCDNNVCVLDAWRAEAALLDMNFSRSAQRCEVGNQGLELGLEASFLALDKPVFLASTWAPNGDLLSSSIRTLDTYRVDKRESSEGFAMQINSGELQAPLMLTQPEPMKYGTLKVSGKVGVPFWNALPSDGRLANTTSFGLPTAEPTLLVPEGELTSINPEGLNQDILAAIADESQSNFTNFNARYDWGTTSLGFQLPVYYALTTLSDIPTFIGRTLGKDLFVMEVNAGINFIEPVRTSLSFGASADFEKLKKVRFQVELGKGDGLAKVDSLLVSTGILNEPLLEPNLDIINNQVEKVNEFAGRGIDELLEKALLEGIEQGGASLGAALPTGEDPIKTLASGMTLLRSVPDQLVSLLDEKVYLPLTNAIDNSETQLRAPLQNIVDQIEGYDPANPVPSEVYNVLSNANAVLDQVANELNRPFDELEAIETQVNDKLVQAQGIVTKTKNSVSEISSLLEDVTDIVDAQCMQSGTIGAEVNGYLDSAFTGVANLRSLSDALQNTAVLGALGELAASDPQVQQNIIKTQSLINDAATNITERLDTAENEMRNVLCSDDPTLVLRDTLLLLNEIDAGVTQINGLLGSVNTAVDDLRDFRLEAQQKVITPISALRQVLSDLENELDTLANSSADGLVLLSKIDNQLIDATAEFDDINIDCLAPYTGRMQCNDVVGVLIEPARDLLREKRSELVNLIKAPFNQQLPYAYLNEKQLRQLLVGKIMDSQPVSELRTLLNNQLVEVTRQIQNVVLMFTDKINEGVQTALSTVEGQVNEALAAATAPIKDIPLTSASIDGFATIAGNELERAHLGAEWTMVSSTEGEPGNTFGAALDIVSWAANDKAAVCSAGDGADLGSNLDVTISAFNIPANIGESKLNIAKVYLGFTLEGPKPIGIAGGIRAEGEIKFTEFQIYDPAFAAGLGTREIYIGAAAGAVFSAIQAEVAFLVGKTCNQDILLDLDPQVAKFIPLPASGFTGAYVRGAASIPVYSNGCPLTIGAAAEIGAWVLAGPPLTVGGLVGGGAYGKVGCIGALRGQIRALGQVNTDGDMTFVGEGFGVAGLGLCEPASWTSVARSRNDGFCGTGDATFRAGYVDGWSIMEISVSAVH